MGRIKHEGSKDVSPTREAIGKIGIQASWTVAGFAVGGPVGAAIGGVAARVATHYAFKKDSQDPK